MKTTHIWDAALAVGVLIAFLVLGQIGWHQAGGKGDVDLWSIISAIATAAATIVALYVAVKTYREKGREERVKARLTAARLTPMLLQSTGKLRAAQSLLEEAAKTSHAPGLYGRTRVIYGEIVNLEPSLDELRSIAILEGNCADRIAAGFAQVRMIHRMLVDDRFIYGSAEAHAPQRRQKASMYIGMTKGLLETLQPAVSICSNASPIKIGGVRVK
jgi:hypothetical protein